MNYLETFIMKRKSIKRLFREPTWFENFIDWLTPYPFNRYGWSDLKYWFIYRLSKKHQYHKAHTGLKPGYYELDVVFEKAIANKRFFSTFEDMYKRFNEIETNPPDPGIHYHTKEYVDAMSELCQAYNWFKTQLPNIEKIIEARYKEHFEKYDGKQDKTSLEYLIMSNSEQASLIEERRDSFKSIQDEEELKYNTTTRHLVNIVRHRVYLYT